MDEAVVRHADLVAALSQAVFESPAETEPALRRAVGAGSPVGDPWRPYAEKVRDHSYRFIYADLAALKTAGRSVEEIFEITVAAATGAALHGLNAGLRALREGR